MLSNLLSIEAALLIFNVINVVVVVDVDNASDVAVVSV